MEEIDEETEDGIDGQLEQMIIENTMLLQGVVNLLIAKNVVSREEIDKEMDKLYEAMEEDFDDDEE